MMKCFCNAIDILDMSSQVEEHVKGGSCLLSFWREGSDLAGRMNIGGKCFDLDFPPNLCFCTHLPRSPPPEIPLPTGGPSTSTTTVRSLGASSRPSIYSY